MGTTFSDEKKLLLAEYRKHGISGEPSEADVILFAERRWHAAYCAWVAECKQTSESEVAA
jgi:hypothetical protein